MNLKENNPAFPSFNQWQKDKKLPHLSILTELKDHKSLSLLLNWLGEHRPTHSQGLEILQLSGELLLMGKNLDSLFKQTTQAEKLLLKLRQLRNPLSSQKMELKSRLIQDLPWLPQIKGRWVRQNDSTGLEIQFKSFSLKDLQQKIKNLNKVYDEIEKKKLWKD